MQRLTLLLVCVAVLIAVAAGKKHDDSDKDDHGLGAMDQDHTPDWREHDDCEDRDGDHRGGEHRGGEHRGDKDKGGEGTNDSLEMKRSQSMRKRGIIIGCSVAGGVTLLMIAAIMAICCTKKNRARVVEEPQKVKDLPPVYTSDEPPFEKKPLGDGVESKAPSGEQKETCGDNVTYGLPTYSSLDVRKESEDSPNVQ